MTERINVAEILRECPRGTELDSPCFDKVVFDRIDDKGRIRCFCGDIRDEVSFTPYGCLNESPSAKCVLFPKGEKGWEETHRSSFKDGDILTTIGGIVFIYKGVSVAYPDGCDFYCGLRSDRHIFIKNHAEEYCALLFEVRQATEEEKNTLFDAIENDGYQWNAETKTLEKLKFDITTLKPFDRVLARNYEDEKWIPAFWGFYVDDDDMECPYNCSGYYYSQCIPYEGNEHLLGTPDNCNEYYKTWKDLS